VALTGWSAVYDTVSREALMRLLPSHHHRPYPWLEVLAHPFKLLGSNLPWSAFALGTLFPGFARLWDDRGRRVLQAFHCWTWPNVFFWSIIPEHAPRHSFPLFPGIAGLAAMVWIAWLNVGRIADFRLQISDWRADQNQLVQSAICNLKSAIKRPERVLFAMVVAWICVKVAFVQVVIPARNHDRQPRAKGEQLASLVPESKTLYLSRLKDEGIMFYYGRTVQRLPWFADLPSSDEPLYCILDRSEWLDWDSCCPVEVVERMRDEQGDPMILLRTIP
jgi:hypothetical protein